MPRNRSRKAWCVVLAGPFHADGARPGALIVRVQPRADATGGKDRVRVMQVCATRDEAVHVASGLVGTLRRQLKQGRDRTMRPSG